MGPSPIKEKDGYLLAWFIGFIESIFFPIPADIMLIPMCLAKKKKAYLYALVLSVFSIVGGGVGYGIGFLFSDVAQSFIVDFLGKEDVYLYIQELFDEYGFLSIFIAGFTPIPYKVFALSAGIMDMSFILFFLASSLSRPLRFFLLAGAIYIGGEALEKRIHKYIEVLGWLCVVAVVLFFLVIH